MASRRLGQQEGTPPTPPPHSPTGHTSRNRRGKLPPSSLAMKTETGKHLAPSPGSGGSREANIWKVTRAVGMGLPRTRRTSCQSAPVSTREIPFSYAPHHSCPHSSRDNDGGELSKDRGRGGGSPALLCSGKPFPATSTGTSDSPTSSGHRPHGAISSSRGPLP